MAVNDPPEPLGLRARALQASAGAAPYLAWLDRRLDPLFAPLSRMRKRFGRVIDRRLPKRFFARSLLIVVLPMVLLQSVVTLVFMERHWNAVTEKLSVGTVREIAMLIDLLEGPTAVSPTALAQVADERLRLLVSVEPPGPLPPPTRKPFFDLLDVSLARAIADEIDRPFWIDTVNDSDVVRIIVKLPDANLRVFAPRSRAYAKNSHIFLVWMATTALVLIAIAILFLRGQVRPIQQLADAAESFGRGQPMPSAFRPRGAQEVRRAGLAFIQMRERIERQIDQRTRMLTGVSHDLRTVLTRLRLQLAVASPQELDPEVGDELRVDLDEMRDMLNAYMEFARGEAGEDAVEPISLSEAFERAAADCERRGLRVETRIEGGDIVHARATAFSRLFGNLVANAAHHARSRIRLTAWSGERSVLLRVEDDGPGIPEERVADALKPFVRLGEDASEDRARNQNVGGSGLGLAIALDIARSHGGDLNLSRSPLGGLMAEVRLPI